MKPLVQFHDALAVIIPEVAADITPAVSSTVPKPRPESFVVLSRSGGPAATPISDGAQITADSWAPTQPEAAELAQEVRASFYRLDGARVDGVQIYRVEEFSGPTSTPDPATGSARYRQTFTVHIRGFALTS